MFIKKFLNKICNKNAEMKKSDEKITLLVNCSYDFLCFADAEHKEVFYENKYTGKIVRFNIADGTICPV